MSISLISVVIPAYNSENTIVSAIDSVLLQTVNNVEIIVVNDGSRDKTHEVCQQYLPRIKYRYQENQGVSVARNVGIRMAEGNYIALLDSDDLMFPQRLEIQKNILECRNLAVDFVFSEFDMWRNGYIVKNASKKFFNIFKEKVFLSFDQIFDQKVLYNETIEKEQSFYIYKGDIVKGLIHGNFILPSTIMFRNYQNCLFDSTYKNYEDYKFFCCLAKNFCSAYIDYPLVLYRRQEDSLSSKKNYARILKNVYKVVISEWKEDAYYYNQFKKDVDLSIAKKSYSLGLYYYNVGNFSESLFYFKKSLYYKQLQKKCYFLFINVLIKFWLSKFFNKKS